MEELQIKNLILAEMVYIFNSFFCPILVSPIHLSAQLDC